MFLISFFTGNPPRMCLGNPPGLLLEGAVWVGVDSSFSIFIELTIPISFFMEWIIPILFLWSLYFLFLQLFHAVHAWCVCNCTVVSYLSFLDFGIADKAQEWPSSRIPSAWLWHRQILWVLPQIQLRMVKTSSCAQPGEIRGDPLPLLNSLTEPWWSQGGFGICYQGAREKRPQVAAGEV